MADWMTRAGLAMVLAVGATGLVHAQPPQPTIVESPAVKVLTGLTAPVFEEEMRQMVQALGVTCGYCHVRGNFVTDESPKKLIARRMLEMTKALNTSHFPDYRPKDGDSVLGRVTCFTCHQGEIKPKVSAAHERRPLAEVKSDT